MIGGAAFVPFGPKMGFYGKKAPSLSRLRELLTYDRQSGLWIWNENRGPQWAGRVAGSINQDGYIQIRVDRRLYMAHVLAWYYSFEIWPDRQVDHENGDPSDNRLNNLRLGMSYQNLGNSGKRKHNSSGFKGVSRHGKKWRAEIAHIKLGVFDTPELAAAAYERAAKIRYGEFARVA
jgi:hypothetical protein